MTLEQNHVSTCPVASVLVLDVPVQRLLESLLIKVVTDEANGATKDEESVKCTNREVFRSLIRCESAGAL